MKIISWNVNGYRAIYQKGFADWFKKTNADIIGLQEVKGHKDAVNPEWLEFQGYTCFWHAAKKPGYSGTAVWSRIKPLKYQEGIGVQEIDDEGRVQILEFDDFYLLNAYFPNSQDERARLQYKLNFCDEILKWTKKARKKKEVIIQGDLNIAHTSIDLKNPKTNEDSPGYYIEERNWMSDYLKLTDMKDAFRDQNPGGEGLYTWWSYRMNARARNTGWRIDYHLLSEGLTDRIKKIDHERSQFGSDHCPVFVELK